MGFVLFQPMHGRMSAHAAGLDAAGALSRAADVNAALAALTARWDGMRDAHRRA